MNLKEDEKTLKKEKIALKSKLETWKQDILAREKNLTKRKQTYQEVLENTLTLEKLQKELERNLESEKVILKQNQNQFEMISIELEEKSKIYQQSLNGLKLMQRKNLTTLEENLKRKKEILNQKLTTLESSLTKKREILKLNLKSLEKDQLKELTKEIVKEIPNCPKELKQYLMLGELQPVMMKDSKLTRDTKHILHLLEVELGKSNKTLEWFLEEFKEDVI